MTITITLTTAGADTGPFLLYSDADGFTSAFEIGVTKASLEVGYTSILVPDYTTVIRVMSEGICTNYIDIPITTTTTTTTDPFAKCLDVNPTFDGNIDGWTVGGADPSWIWVPDYGGSAAWHGGDVIGWIGQYILTPGNTYRITFDLTIIDGGCGPSQSVVQVSAGTTSSSWIDTFGTTAIDLTLTCTDTTLFAISASDNCRYNPYNYIFIDNVCVVQV